MCRIALVVMAALLLSACRSATKGQSASPPAAPTSAGTPAAGLPADGGDRVASVTLVCRYVTLEDGSQVTREGEDSFCRPATPHTVGTVAVLRVFDVRAILTIRSPTRSDYTVETRDTEVQVGDPWPPPGR